jgi:hypothetical protein
MPTPAQAQQEPTCTANKEGRAATCSTNCRRQIPGRRVRTELALMHSTKRGGMAQTPARCRHAASDRKSCGSSRLAA